MEKVKSGAMFAVKVIVVLAIASAVLNFFGINLFQLISSPVNAVKALVNKPKAA
jgi:hypothetical protein